MRDPTGFIERLPAEVTRYQLILETYWKMNVLQDRKFQRLFNGFYQLRQRPLEWYENFYRILEGLKNKEQTFAWILQELFRHTGRVEASFASKALATRDPEQPIIDKWVLAFLKERAGLTAPPQSAPDRMDRWVEFYDRMARWYRWFGSTPEGAERIQRFDVICPGMAFVTDLKKLDFMIWITKGEISLLRQLSRHSADVTRCQA